MMKTFDDMLRKVVFTVCVVVLLIPEGSVNVGVTHGLERIGLYDPVPGMEEITVKMAKNEYEPFQIVIRSDTTENVTVTISSLYDKEGTLFSQRNFTLYKVHYIYVKEPSPRSKASPGWYPDGLIPLPSRVFTVEGGENSIVWVDVYAPEDQKSGMYSGVIRIEMGKVMEIPLTVEVWNFTLPEKVSLKSGVEVMVYQIIEAHDLSWDPEELEPVLYHYYETLIEHRLMPWELYFSEPEVSTNGSIDMEDNHEHLEYFMDVLQVNCLSYPLYEDWPFRDPFGRNLEKTTRYLRELHEYYVKNGWEDRFFFYIIDEPNSERAYDEVRDISRKLREIHPDIKFLVTEQMVPDDPSWGDLYGYVDIWCPLFPCIEDEKELIKERQSLGEEVWTYTALTQGEQETPFWELDFPVLNYRVVLWMIWNSRISGLVYWTCNWWEGVSDPWEDPGTWTDNGEVYNGEGVLVYPGDDACLPSIRLKVLREGFEDYEYFTLLTSLGKESVADRQVERIVKSWYEWDKNPDKLLEVRRILGEEINNIMREGLEKLPEEPQGEGEREEIEYSAEEKEEKVEKEEKEEFAEKGEDISEPTEDMRSGMTAVLVGLVVVVVFVLIIRSKKNK